MFASIAAAILATFFVLGAVTEALAWGPKGRGGPSRCWALPRPRSDAAQADLNEGASTWSLTVCHEVFRLRCVPLHFEGRVRLLTLVVLRS